MSTTCSGCCASSRPPRRWCRPRCCAPRREPSRTGVIYFGSTAPAMHEALATLEAEGVQLDALRVRAFPFHRRGVTTSSPPTTGSSWSSRTATPSCAPC